MCRFAAFSEEADPPISGAGGTYGAKLRLMRPMCALIHAQSKHAGLSSLSYQGSLVTSAFCIHPNLFPAAVADVAPAAAPC